MRIVLPLQGFAVTGAAVLLLSSLALGAEIEVAQAKTDISLRLEVETAIGKGLTWLATQQKPEGFWSMQENPAISALVLTAFQGDQSGYYKRKFEPVANKGFDYILKCVKPDGGIYVKDMINYNTSISMMALLVANRPEFEPTIRKARNYIIGLQDTLGDNPLDGGVGYGGTYKHSDITDTSFALEALYYSRRLNNDLAGGEVKDLNWKAAVRFISRTQNLPEYNDQKWASDDPDNVGGFVYFPGNSKAGEVKLPNGKVALASSGSVSYAGLMSYLYAQMGKNDPRVKAVYDYLVRHYTLEENPGMGKQGLFYYYHTMAKALNIYGVENLPLKDGKSVNWRRELAKKLLDEQKGDGFWVNDNGRFLEKDPNLVTAYAVITLEIISHGL